MMVLTEGVNFRLIDAHDEHDGGPVEIIAQALDPWAEEILAEGEPHVMQLEDGRCVTFSPVQTVGHA